MDLVNLSSWGRIHILEEFFFFFFSTFVNADRDRTGVEVRALRIDQIQRLSIRRLAHSVIGIRRYTILCPERTPETEVSSR